MYVCTCSASEVHNCLLCNTVLWPREFQIGRFHNNQWTMTWGGFYVWLYNESQRSKNLIQEKIPWMNCPNLLIALVGWIHNQDCIRNYATVTELCVNRHQQIYLVWQCSHAFIYSLLNIRMFEILGLWFETIQLHLVQTKAQQIKILTLCEVSHLLICTECVMEKSKGIFSQNLSLLHLLNIIKFAANHIKWKTCCTQLSNIYYKYCY